MWSFLRMWVGRENPERISDLLLVSNKFRTDLFVAKVSVFLSLLKQTYFILLRQQYYGFCNDQLLKLNPSGLKETRELSKAELHPWTLEMTADTFSIPAHCHALYPVCVSTWTLRHKQWISLIEFAVFCPRWMQAHTWCKLWLIILWGLAHMFAYALSVDHQDY